MEILIVGGALVALMVYVSTKIKKSAAGAYERETVETEKFSIVKPENFINPIGKNSEFVFVAYSKDFGTGDAEEIRQAEADLRIYAGGIFDNICRNVKSSARKIISEETVRIADGKVYFARAEKNENNIETVIFYKIIESQKLGEVYELKISVLREYLENYSMAINELSESFTVK